MSEIGAKRLTTYILKIEMNRRNSKSIKSHDIIIFLRKEKIPQLKKLE